MGTSSDRAIAYFANPENAAASTARYNGGDRAAAYSFIYNHLRPTDRRILDIGGGHGVVTAPLAENGCYVTIVEPAAAMRVIGEQQHQGKSIVWVDDSLPALDTLSGKFDAIILHRVLMFMDEADRSAAIARCLELLPSNGRLFIANRHGPDSPERGSFPIGDSEMLDLAKHHHVLTLFEQNLPDPTGRPDVEFRHYVWQKPALG